MSETWFRKRLKPMRFVFSEILVPCNVFFLSCKSILFDAVIHKMSAFALILDDYQAGIKWPTVLRLQ